MYIYLIKCGLLFGSLVLDYKFLSSVLHDAWLIYGPGTVF